MVLVLRRRRRDRRSYGDIVGIGDIEPMGDADGIGDTEGVGIGCACGVDGGVVIEAPRAKTPVSAAARIVRFTMRSMALGLPIASNALTG
jgi:hypothetical protein